ncbi:MAG: NUDIX domain-containing protein [Coprococcus sp.]
MEMLDIVDENGEPTGETVERSAAHANGIRHRTSHVWLLRKRPDGIEVLLQKRSEGKDSFPGCYDISSAGHIPAGMGFKESALRELKEELGLMVSEEELIDCGLLKLYEEAVFYGEPFKDDQVSRVFYIWKDVEPEQMILQTSEVSEVRWMKLSECKEKVRNNSIPHCIVVHELEMLPG